VLTAKEGGNGLDDSMNCKKPKDDHQHSKMELKEGDGRYRALADSLPQRVAEIDVTGNITFANLNGSITFGYTKEECFTPSAAAAPLRKNMSPDLSKTLACDFFRFVSRPLIRRFGCIWGGPEPRLSGN